MHKTRERFIWGIRILLLAAAVVFSFALPWLWQRSYDAKMENKLEKFSANVTTYQMQYESFVQKLELLAACEVSGIELESLAVEDYEEAMSAERLSQIVCEQLEELEEDIEVYAFPVEQICAETMTERVKYTMYAAADEINISGIDFWEVSYQLDEVEISLKLDSEFYKIYELQVDNDSIYNDMWQAWREAMKMDKYQYPYDVFPAESLYQIREMVFNGLFSYWGIHEEDGYGWVEENLDDDAWYGIIHFYKNDAWTSLEEQSNGKINDVWDSFGKQSAGTMNDITSYEEAGSAGTGLKVQLMVEDSQGFGLWIQK